MLAISSKLAFLIGVCSLVLGQTQAHGGNRPSWMPHVKTRHGKDTPALRSFRAAFQRPNDSLWHVMALRGGGSVNDVPFQVRDTCSKDKVLPTQPFHHRGGDQADIDKSSTWSLSSMQPMDIVYLTLHGALLACIVLFCRNANRTGGVAPTWFTNHVMGDPYATGVMHMSFFGLGFLLPWILPARLARIVFSPTSVALLGYVFPAIESVRAAVTDSGSDDRTWLMYWVIQGIFQYSTEFMDQFALKYNLVYRYWHCLEVLVVVWLVLPLTDGATLIYKTLAQPYLVPAMQPIKNMADSWISMVALTTINASYIWWFSFIFMSLPVIIKRYAVMGVGSIFPIVSTVMALASTEDNSEMRWLTYWPCFSFLYLIMIGIEKFVGSFKGLYVVCLAATLYLMLPMFDGSMKIFRKVLVPLLGQHELLLLRDAQSLATELFKRVPAHRQEEARQAAAKAFLGE